MLWTKHQHMLVQKKTLSHRAVRGRGLITMSFYCGLVRRWFWVDSRHTFKIAFTLCCCVVNTFRQFQAADESPHYPSVYPRDWGVAEIPTTSRPTPMPLYVLILRWWGIILKSLSEALLCRSARAPQRSTTLHSLMFWSFDNDEWTDSASQHYVGYHAVFSLKEDRIFTERRPFTSLSSPTSTCSSPREQAREEISRLFTSIVYLEKVSPLPPSHCIYSMRRQRRKVAVSPDFQMLQPYPVCG